HVDVADLSAPQQRWKPAIVVRLPHPGDVRLGAVTDTYRSAAASVAVGRSWLSHPTLDLETESERSTPPRSRSRICRSSRVWLSLRSGVLASRSWASHPR